MTSPSPQHRAGTYQRGEDTSRRLVETAIEVFGTHGYEGASTRMLAERAGVNLPAIQYYFGSKEGLYRAAIGHILQEFKQSMAPSTERAQTRLADPNLSRKELLELLHGVLDAFVALVIGRERPESWSRFLGRAEIENLAALEPLSEGMIRGVVRPCAALIGRLLDTFAESEPTVLRTLAILGQITIFHHKGMCQSARRALGWTEFDGDRVLAVQRLVRQQTDAILRAAKAPAAERRPVLQNRAQSAVR